MNRASAYPSDQPVALEPDRLQGLFRLARSANAILDRVPMSILTLILRLSVASVFLKSGLNKTDNWDITVALFRDEYQVPLLMAQTAAYLGTTVELLCPVLLILGLLTRLATLPLLGMTLVIQTFVYPENWSEHLMWAGVLLVILTRGPGVFSLDYLIGRRFVRN